MHFVILVGAMASQRCLHPNPRNLYTCYFTWQIGFKIVDGIKVANQLNLGWRDYPGLPRWAQCNYEGPFKWKREAERQNQIGGSLAPLALRLKEWDDEAVASRSWKNTLEADSRLEPPEDSCPLRTLILLFFFFF